jgi:hypothetical protein
VLDCLTNIELQKTQACLDSLLGSAPLASNEVNAFASRKVNEFLACQDVPKKTISMLAIIIKSWPKVIALDEIPLIHEQALRCLT